MKLLVGTVRSAAVYQSAMARQVVRAARTYPAATGSHLVVVGQP